MGNEILIILTVYTLQYLTVPDGVCMSYPAVLSTHGSDTWREVGTSD